MDVKEFLKKNGLAILCAISILALLLPFGTIKTSVTILGNSSENTSNIGGFHVVSGGTLGFLLAVGPVVLIAMNYIKQLEKHKGMLAIVIPVVCLLILIVNMMNLKQFAVKGGGDGGFDTNTNASIGIGAIILALAYIGTGVLGAVTYHNFTLDKAGLEKLKATAILSNIQEKVVGTIENFQSDSDKSVSAQHSAENLETGTVSPAKQKKATNIGKIGKTG